MNLQKDLNDMEKYMTTLQEVKISLAKIDEKMNQLTDLKTDIEKIAEIANESHYTTKQHEKDIDELWQKTEDIIDNDRKKWVAIFTVSGAFVLQIVYFLMTYHIK